MSETQILPHLFALAGPAGAGKTTAADYLVRRHGYIRLKFADPLKDMLRAIGLTEAEIEGDLKEVPSKRLCGQSPRWAMQALGTEWGRRCIGDRFWVNLWAARAGSVFAHGGRVVVDDCRFLNEAEAIRHEGGIIVGLTGRGGITGGHESERVPISADTVVANDGSVALLESHLEGVLARWSERARQRRA